MNFFDQVDPADGARSHLRELTFRIPSVAIPFNGDCAQRIGLDLPIVVINLPHRTDRWHAICDRMADIGLNKLIRVPAVVGAQLSTEEIGIFLGKPADAIDAPPPDHFALTRPAVGCFMSHVAVWKWVIERNLPRVLIFEDDAVPAAEFEQNRFIRFVASLSESDGLVFAGQRIMAGLADQPDGVTLPRLYYFNGTFAYMITPAACNTLLRALETPYAHIDHQISHALIRRRKDFTAVYAEPRFFDSDWSLGSDCSVPMSNETDADRQLGAVVTEARNILIGEGRPLLDK